MFERKDDEHHMLYVYLVLPKGVGLSLLRFPSSRFGFLPTLSDSVSGEFVELTE